jgi:FkbM family methyltransferase
MVNALKRLSYRPEVLKPVQKLGLSSALRRAYFHFAKPAGGILETQIAGIHAKFYVRTPEELRILESAGGAGGEQRVMAVLKEFLRPGDAALDIGANVGLYTMLLASAVGPAGLVAACEPGNSNSRHLTENLELNGLKNVRVFRKALGDRSGTATLYASTVIGNSNLSNSGKGDGAGEEVEIIEGDRLIATEGLPIPRAIKIDVEGFEYAVMHGLRETLKSDSCRMVTCEVHPSLLPSGVEPRMVGEFLESSGFDRLQSYPRWDGTFHLVATKTKG